ncbi:cysteine desulfurase [Candidatus Saccharibacteria bacterium]|nr:cysteine desulfurase [Candidatus Saccharibacteria bacterium]MCL1962954.1 cysteine desulfurase [Candidatus Saccharibacteria bacterium]
MNRADFPIFKGQPDLVYLDSANTTLKPRTVIDAVRRYYEDYSANVGRATYDLAERATAQYESTRNLVADFIGANPDEIIFTHSASYAINFAVFGLKKFLHAGDVILLTEYEHNSNIIAWQKVAAETGAEIVYLPSSRAQRGNLDRLLRSARNGKKIKTFSYSLISNITGELFDHRELSAWIRARGGLVLVDATQAVGRMSVDVNELNCDFLVFSSHKIYGPSGVGVLCARSNAQTKLEPIIYGSQTFTSILPQTTELSHDYSRFEPGTPNIEGVIGLGAAIEYVNSVIATHDQDLTQYAIEKLEQNDLKKYLIGEPQVGILSLNHPTIHPHDFAMLLNQKNIAVRAGKACGDILMQKLGLNRGVVRISFGIYTTKTDIDKFIAEYQNAIGRLT